MQGEGEKGRKGRKEGGKAKKSPTGNTTGDRDQAAGRGTRNPDTKKRPKHLVQGYLNIYNNYFKAPWRPDRTEANQKERNQED
ncbi:capsid protein, partial [Escherichia coli]|nr:capsid protein [Escherichia coli]